MRALNSQMWDNVWLLDLLDFAWSLGTLGAVVDWAPHSVTPTAQDSPPRRELFFLFVLLWKKNQVGGVVQRGRGSPF